MRKTEVCFWMFIWLFIGFFYFVQLSEDVMPTTENAQTFIVIDSGHGFFDQGKVGKQGAVEKDINLAIAQKVASFLGAQGYQVKMTREDDICLYDQTRPDTKREDMNKRLSLINAAGCMLAVSIHQNSFTDSRYSGAQVFYYKEMEEARVLADCIQKSLILRVDPTNTRQIKADDSYYLLKNARIPAVICECGFLSNENEEIRLKDERYQEKIAFAITIGILEYLAMI